MLAHEWALTVVFVWGSLHALTVARYTLTKLSASHGERTGRFLGKGGAVRTATAAALATGADFSLFTVLLWGTGLSAPVATFLGAVTGGIINFSLNRTWTFNASGTNLKMARRYIGVSGTSALLNASFVAMLLWVPGQLPVFAWLIARGLVFLAWNYPLHRDYVFEHLGSRASAH
jgi:putative flippase GtrA